MNVIAKSLTARHMRLVVTILNEGSMVRAAASLNMTQSAVTKALQEAEQLIGVALFDRTNRGVTPTIFGSALAARARLILAQIENAGLELADLRDGTGGRIAVGTLLAGSAGLLPSAIARLRRDRPKLVVTVVEGTNDVLMPSLRSGELDLVIGRLPEFRQRSDLAQEQLMNDFAQVVVRRGHPISKNTAPKLSDLTSYDWVLPSQQTTLRRQIDKAFRDNGLEVPSPVVESVSLLTTRGLLHETDYLAVWPVQVARIEMQSGAITSLPLSLPTTVSPIGITTRMQDSLSPAAEMLIRCLRTTAEFLEEALRHQHP
jgi:DNA-binding transcriptional LysR family regulator